MQPASIKKNYLYNTLYQVLILIIPFITTPYASRIFGAEGVGIQSYTNSIASIFVLFATFGTATYGQREIARNRDNKEKVSKLFWEIEVLNIICTSISLIIWLIFILLVEQYKIYYVVWSMQVIAVAFDITWLYGGYEQFKVITIRNAFVKIIGTIILFAFVRTKNDLLLYIGLTAATGLIGNISMWTYLRKFICKVRLKELNIRSHFKNTLVYFIPTLATSIYTILDKTMIGIITGDNEENGYYEQATKIINMAKTFVLSLNTVMYARMSYIFSENKIEEMKKLLKKSLNYIIFISIPITLGIISIANRFVPWYFGEGYEKVIFVLYVYSPLIVIIGLSNCLNSQYLTPSGQRSRSNKAIILGAVINFTLNILIIPFIKSIGAAITSVIAEVVILMLYVHMTDSIVTWKKLFVLSYKKIVAGLVMLLAVLLVGINASSTIITTVIQIFVGAIIYFIILFIWKDEFLMEYKDKLLNKIRKK